MITDERPFISDIAEGLEEISERKRNWRRIASTFQEGHPKVRLVGLQDRKSIRTTITHSSALHALPVQDFRLLSTGQYGQPNVDRSSAVHGFPINEDGW